MGVTTGAREDSTSNSSPREVLLGALRSATYEVLPFKSTEKKVLEHVPRDVALTITATGGRGIEHTIDLAVRLRAEGYDAAPHLAARLIQDESHLGEIVDRLRTAGVTSVFVIAGDEPQPAGPFPDALSLLERMEAIEHPFTTVGIGGYPEGHGSISDDLIEKAVEAKAQHASQIITQLCFDAATTAEWARGLQSRGVTLPIRVGIPGVVSRQKLVRISAGLGLGRSARFLKKQQNMFWRFFLPGGYSPGRLVDRLAPYFGQTDNGLAGFHVFTFNEVEATEAWRRDRIAALSA